MLSAKQLHHRRASRTRYNIKQNSHGRLRLSVHRSGKNISAQIIDDKAGKTLVAASSVEKDVRGKLKTGANKDAAKNVGQLVAERAIKAGIKEVVFDRGGYLYHGRVKELAEAAREAGLDF
jgi:large subunit ribosomal protein L18